MTTLTLSRPTLFEAVDGEPTLDELLVGAWEGLTARRTVQCPICGGEEMAPEYGVDALPIGGRCKRCGSTLR